MQLPYGVKSRAAFSDFSLIKTIFLECSLVVSIRVHLRPIWLLNSQGVRCYGLCSDTHANIDADTGLVRAQEARMWSHVPQTAACVRAGTSSVPFFSFTFLPVLSLCQHNPTSSYLLLLLLWNKKKKHFKKHQWFTDKNKSSFQTWKKKL